MSRLLAFAGALLLGAGGYLLYAGVELLEPEALGERAASTLTGSTELRLALSPTIASTIGQVSPAAEPSAGEVELALADPRVGAAFAAASAALAAEVLGPGDRRPVLDLSAVTATAAGVSAGTPDAQLLAADALDSARVELTGVDFALDALSVTDDATSLGPFLAAIGAALLVAAIALAPGLLRGVSRAGAAIAITATLGAGALLAGRFLIAGQFDDDLTGRAVEAVWDGLLGDLLLGTCVVGVAAIVLAFLAGSAASARAR